MASTISSQQIGQVAAFSALPISALYNSTEVRKQKLITFVSAIAFRISPPVMAAITHRSEQTKDGRRALTALKASLLLYSQVDIHTKLKIGETLVSSLFSPTVKVLIKASEKNL